MTDEELYEKIAFDMAVDRRIAAALRLWSWEVRRERGVDGAALMLKIADELDPSEPREADKP